MRLHRFIGDFKLKTGSLKIHDEELLNQLRNVLKLRAGEKIIFCDGNKNEAVAEIKSYGRDLLEVDIVNIGTNSNESKINAILYCAILKKENFEMVSQKATECGISAIVPIITERTIKLDIRMDRLEKIIREAGEQSGRGVLPTISKPREYSDLIKEPMVGFNMFLDSSGEGVESFERLSVDQVGIWVGPEGGWADSEIVSAKNSGFKITSLGKTTLRAETAAVIGSYLAIHNL